MTTEMSEANQKAIAEGRRHSLLKAGIGEALIHRSLGTIACGETIGAWLAGSGAATIRKGESWCMELRTKEASLVLPLIARALHLSGTGCRVMRIGRMARMVEVRAYDELDELLSIPALFVLDFFEAAARPVERPFLAYQKRQIQDVLSDRVSSGRANILQVTNPAGVAFRLSDWWDQAFIDGLSANIFKVMA